MIVDHDEPCVDGVNIAAHVESLAKPGGFGLSAFVFEQIEGARAG